MYDLHEEKALGGWIDKVQKLADERRWLCKWPGVKTQLWRNSFHHTRADTGRKALPKLIELCAITARLVGASLRDSNTLPGGEGGERELPDKDSWYRAGTLYGEATARGHSPYPFIHHFYQEWHPFHIPSLELCQNQNDFSTISQACEIH